MITNKTIEGDTLKITSQTTDSKALVVTSVRLIDTGGDVCYMRELDLKRRDGAGTIYRTDIVVRVEEKEHV